MTGISPKYSSEEPLSSLLAINGFTQSSINGTSRKVIYNGRTGEPIGIMDYVECANFLAQRAGVDLPYPALGTGYTVERSRKNLVL